MSRERLAAIALVGVAMTLAFVWFWPTLHVGLRSDDYLIVYYYDRTTGALHWGRMLEEFVRPWFGAAELYRPMVSTSFAVDILLWPSPLGFHFQNVMITAVAVAAIALTARRLLPTRSAISWIAALAGAVLLLLHPATVEPTAWIAGRTNSLELAFGALASWLFLRHLDGACGRAPMLVAFVLALCSKESAAALPLTFVMLDLLHGQLRNSSRTWGARLRLHAPAFVVLALYLVWRLLLLGQIGPVSNHATMLERVHNLSVRMGQLVAPPTADYGYPLGWLWWLGIVPGLCLTLRRGALLVPVWAALLLLPSTHLVAGWQVFWGRLLEDAVPVLAFAAAIAIGCSRHAWARLLALVATVLVCVSLAAISSSWLSTYERQGEISSKISAQLAQKGATATPAAPLAVAGLPPLPLFHPKVWGLLGLVPFAPNDLAIVGLPELLMPDKEAPESFADAAPVVAIQQSGGRLATWHAERQELVMFASPVAGRAQLQPDSAAAGNFVAKAAWPGSVAAVHVVLPKPAKELRLRLLDDLPDDRAFGEQVATGPMQEWWFDLSHALAPMLIASAGLPFRGVHLVADGAAVPAGTTVELHGTMPMHEVIDPVAGRTFDMESFEAVLRPPSSATPLRLYLILPTGVRCMDLAPGSAFALSPALREHLSYAQMMITPVAVHWFWQSVSHSEQPWHTRLDYAVLR